MSTWSRRPRTCGRRSPRRSHLDTSGGKKSQTPTRRLRSSQQWGCTLGRKWSCQYRLSTSRRKGSRSDRWRSRSNRQDRLRRRRSQEKRGTLRKCLMECIPDRRWSSHRRGNTCYRRRSTYGQLCFSKNDQGKKECK